MNPDDMVKLLVKEHGFTLLRSRRHHVMRSPRGGQVAFACTPRDLQRWLRNTVRDLRRIGVDIAPNGVRRMRH